MSHNVSTCCMRTASHDWKSKIWPFSWRDAEDFFKIILINCHAVIVGYLVSRGHIKQSRRKADSVRSGTNGTGTELRLNNSWLTELGWPWNIPRVGLLKPDTAHLGQRKEVETDGHKLTNGSSQFSWSVHIRFFPFSSYCCRLRESIMSHCHKEHSWDCHHCCSHVLFIWLKTGFLSALDLSSHVNGFYCEKG